MIVIKTEILTRSIEDAVKKLLLIKLEWESILEAFIYRNKTTNNT